MKNQYKYKSFLTLMLNKMLQSVSIYKHRYKSRKALLALDDRMLKDIGIAKEIARKEGERYFWQGESDVLNSKESKRLTHKLLVAVRLVVE